MKSDVLVAPLRRRQTFSGALGLAAISLVLFGLPILYRGVSARFQVPLEQGTIPIACFNAASALGSPPVLIVLRHYRIQDVIRVSIALFSFAIAVAIAARNIGIVSLALSVGGLSAGIFSASTYAAASNRSRRDVSWLVLSALVANAIGLPVLGAYSASSGAVVWCLGIVLMLGVASLATASEFHGELRAPRPPSAGKGNWLLGSTFLKTLAAYLIYPVLGAAPFLAQNALGLAIILELYTVCGLFGALVLVLRPPENWRWFGATTLLAGAAGMTLLGTTLGTLTSVCGIALWGWAGWSYLVPSRIGITRVSGEFDTEMLALNTSGTNLAAAIGLGMAPLLESHVGFQRSCCAGAAVSVASLACWYFGQRGERSPHARATG